MGTNPLFPSSRHFKDLDSHHALSERTIDVVGIFPSKVAWKGYVSLILRFQGQGLDSPGGL